MDLTDSLEEVELRWEHVLALVASVPVASAFLEHDLEKEML
jgi:hypothetical protein